MLHSNRTLLRCNLSFNHFGEPTGQEMIRALTENHFVEQVDIGNNLMNLRYVDYVDAKCRKNRTRN